MARRGNLKPSLKTNEKIGGKKLSDKATLVQNVENTDNQKPVFSFKYSHDRYPLHDWGKRDLKSLIKALQMMESLTWIEIKKQGREGPLRYTSINQQDFPKDVPNNISPDETIIEIKVGDPCRLFGIRSGKTFHIIWFDRRHGVYNMS